MLTIEGLNTHYGASHVLQGVDLVVPAGASARCWAATVSARRRRCAR